MARENVDFMWIAEAAGEDHRKLAETAILLAGFCMLREMSRDPEDEAQVKRDLREVTIVMDYIAKKMNLPPSAVMAAFRATMADS